MGKKTIATFVSALAALCAFFVLFAVVPGSAFGAGGKHCAVYIRFLYKNT